MLEDMALVISKPFVVCRYCAGAKFVPPVAAPVVILLLSDVYMMRALPLHKA